MSADGIADRMTRWEPWSFLLGGLVPGVALGLVLSPYYPPFGMAAGLFGGSSLTLFLLVYLFRVR